MSQLLSLSLLSSRLELPPPSLRLVEAGSESSSSSPSSLSTVASGKGASFPLPHVRGGRSGSPALGRVLTMVGILGSERLSGGLLEEWDI